MRKSLLTLASLFASCGALFSSLLFSGQGLRAESPPISIQALQLPSGLNDMAWDGTRARFFVSSGTNVLIVNPETDFPELRFILSFPCCVRTASIFVTAHRRPKTHSWPALPMG